VLGKSLALAYVKPQHADVGAQMEIEILGERKKATVLGESPFDPENQRLRA
jgi:dimethylglycine dehydrogenase